MSDPTQFVALLDSMRARRVNQTTIGNKVDVDVAAIQSKVDDGLTVEDSAEILTLLETLRRRTGNLGESNLKVVGDIDLLEVAAVELGVIPEPPVVYTDPLTHPYGTYSIWKAKLPVDESDRVPWPLPVSPGVFSFRPEEDLIIATPDAPLVPIMAHDAAWSSRKRCDSRTGGGLKPNYGYDQLRFPIDTTWHTDQYIGYAGSGRPNHSAAIVMPDYRLFETQPLHICPDGVVVSQYGNPLWQGDSIIDGGLGTIGGSHGGGYMTAFGGTIRVGELDAGLIEHALKICVNTAYCMRRPFPGRTENDVKTWPALAADNGSWGDGGYGSNAVAEMPNSARMGLLACLLQSFDLAQLPELGPCRTIAQALKDHGAYLVDGDHDVRTPPFMPFMFACEWGPNGRTIQTTPLYGFDLFEKSQNPDYLSFLNGMRIIEANLFIVEGNNPARLDPALVRVGAPIPAARPRPT